MHDGRYEGMAPSHALGVLGSFVKTLRKAPTFRACAQKIRRNFSPGGSLRTCKILSEAFNTDQREQAILRAGAAAYSDGANDLGTDDQRIVAELSDLLQNLRHLASRKGAHSLPANIAELDSVQT